MTATRALVGVALRSLSAAPVPITLPQHRVLLLLATHGDQTIGQLADELGIDQSNASRICDRVDSMAAPPDEFCRLMKFDAVGLRFVTGG